MPTTLLSQVDSSVGGKTGVDTSHGKNLVGAFHQPSLVLTDLDTLKTLPPREFRSGYAEVVKYGALGDAVFFRWLEQNADAVFDQERDDLAYAIETSCQMKAEIVSRDEREAGDRALLNLGHTFGHAIEAWAGYSGEVLHGEAIALGMVLAGEFSFKQGFCGSQVASRLKTHLGEYGLPVSFADLRKQAGRGPGLDELMSFMEQDKKVKDGEMTLVLFRGMGDTFVAPQCCEIQHSGVSAVPALNHQPRGLVCGEAELSFVSLWQSFPLPGRRHCGPPILGNDAMAPFFRRPQQ